MISSRGKRMNYLKILTILVLYSFFFVWLYGHQSAWAQGKEYPNKPIKILIPFNPGGFVDLSARIMTDYLSRELKVPMVAENKGGAGGMVGASVVYQTKADGYTLLVTGNGPIIFSPLESPNPPYDPLKDFLPICMYGMSPNVIAVHKSSPFKTLSDIAAEAKRNPGKLNCGVSAVSGSVRMILEIFKKEASLNIKTLPLTGAGELITALLGNHIDMGSTSYVSILSFVKSGELKIIATDDPVPGSSFQTFAEAGYSQPKMKQWVGVFVSSKTPKPVYEKLVHSFERVVKNPELGRKWEAIGLVADYQNPTEFANYLKEQWSIASKLIVELGLKQ